MKPLSERLSDRVLLQRGEIALSYRARDAVLDRPVFVKVLNPALAAEADFRARFEREAKAVARLDHPHLVRIFEYGDDPVEGPYMLLEWVEGFTLASRLESGERFSGEKFLELARQLLSGLAALHSVGILHRDLKPENILVKSKSGDTDVTVYKITDFSLAALRDAPKLTHHEAIVGTPAYMAPEQAAGGAPTERSDLFSLGVILYEAVTGVNPLLGESLMDTLRKIRENEISFEHAAIAALEDRARDLLQALLSRDPADRPGSARAALHLLEAGETVQDRMPTARAMYTRYVIAGLTVVVVIATLIVYVPKMSRERQVSQLPVADSVRKPTPWPKEVPELRSPVVAETSQIGSVPTAGVVVPVGPRDGSQGEMRGTIGNGRADSVMLHLITDPWAHVLVGGVQLGTTPLAAPLRLPAGRQVLALQNPAYPPIQLALDLKEPMEQQTIRLADYVTTLHATVEPWGDLYLDSEHIGTTPLSHPLFVSPGRHTLRVVHPQFGALEHVIEAAAGEVLTAQVNFALSQFTIQEEKGTP